MQRDMAWPVDGAPYSTADDLVMPPPLAVAVLPAFAR